MLEIILVPGPIVAFKASGTLSGEDYDRLTAEIDRQLDAHEHIGLFADIANLDGLSLPALAKDVQYALSKLGELHRLERVAVVTGKPWLRAWAQLAWMLVPSSTVRTYEAAQHDNALAWASEVSAEAPRRALRWIETTRPDAFAFAWNGTITSVDVDAVLERLERELESHTSVRLLARIEHMGGIRVHALLRTTFARIKALGLQKTERYAIVARANWLERYVAIA
ncbi:MAG TPA: STAS/SEC14 domain-containing protein, partial [Polyangiales bacterium]|nr:STAS/SEC14 domain-containing protein [Polyangiales bacterium]